MRFSSVWYFDSLFFFADNIFLCTTFAVILVCIYLPVYLFSASVPLCLSVFLTLSTCVCYLAVSILSQCLSISVYHSVTVCSYIYFVDLSVFMSVSLCLSMYVSLSVFLNIFSALSYLKLPPSLTLTRLCPRIPSSLFSLPFVTLLSSSPTLLPFLTTIPHLPS